MGRKYQEKRALKLTLQAANKAIRVYCEKLGVVEVKSYIELNHEFYETMYEEFRKEGLFDESAK